MRQLRQEANEGGRAGVTLDRDEVVVAQGVDENFRNRSVMFEVSKMFLEQMSVEADGWSVPVKFRFEKHDYDEGWDLVMKRLEVS